MSPLDRRRFLELGTTATAAALAGCWGADRSESYTDWIPSTDDSMVTAYIDFAVSEKTSTIDPILPLFLPSDDGSNPAQFTPALSGLDGIEEPMLEVPLRTGGQVIGTAALSLAVAGLSDLVDPETPTEGVTELLLANETTIGTGTIDVDSADEALRSGREGAFGEIKYEVVSDGEEFAIYEPVGDADAAVALSDSAVIVADTGSKVQTALSTWRGSHGRAVDENGTFEWLSNTAGAGDMAVGWVGPVQLGDFYWGSTDPDPATDVVTAQADVLSSLTFTPNSREVRAALAVQTDDSDWPSRNRLESQLALTDRRSSLSVDGARVSATTTLTEDDLDIEFVEPTDTATEAPERSTGTPAKVAAAVPDDAFEFSYREDRGVVRVNFVEEFEADEVTVSATETESEVSTTSPGPVSYLTVYVDPEGDEVVVTATVDGASGEVARREVP